MNKKKKVEKIIKIGYFLFFAEFGGALGLRKVVSALVDET